MPRLDRYVFTSDGKTSIGGFGWGKTKLPEASGVTGWTLHDWRRSDPIAAVPEPAFSADTASRCLAHTVGSVRDVYDPRAYCAVETLAAQIERIV